MREEDAVTDMAVACVREQPNPDDDTPYQNRCIGLARYVDMARICHYMTDKQSFSSGKQVIVSSIISILASYNNPTAKKRNVIWLGWIIPSSQSIDKSMMQHKIQSFSMLSFCLGSPRTSDVLAISTIWSALVSDENPSRNGANDISTPAAVPRLCRSSLITGQHT